MNPKCSRAFSWPESQLADFTDQGSQAVFQLPVAWFRDCGRVTIAVAGAEMPQQRSTTDI